MITRNQQFFLDFIKEHEYCDIDFLVDELKIKKNVVSRMLHTLEDKELIVFTHDPSSCTNTMNESAVFESGWIVTPQVSRITYKND